MNTLIFTNFRIRNPKLQLFYCTSDLHNGTHFRYLGLIKLRKLSIFTVSKADGYVSVQDLGAETVLLLNLNSYAFISLFNSSM